jgi:DGQHR domain-containing protein
MSIVYTNDKEIEIIGKIFEKSGIDFIPKVIIKTANQHTDIDILGIYKNIIILVECVGHDTFGPKMKKFFADSEINIESFDKIADILKAKHKQFFRTHENNLKSRGRKVVKLLVALNKETKETVEENQLAYCETNSITLWTEENYYYFEKISDCTYDHCKYEIFDSFNIKPSDIVGETKEQVTPTYLAYGKEIKQNLYIINFVVPVDVLLKRSTIRRFYCCDTEEGYQRLLDKNKLKKMRQYLLTEIGTYPNNIICALNIKSNVKEIGKKIEVTIKDIQESAKVDTIKEGIKDNLFLVELPNSHEAFEIIDGQHRLFSFAQTKYEEFENTKEVEGKKKLRQGDARIQELSRQMYLTVTAIYSKNEDWGDPGKLFLEINTTQTRVKPEDLIDLLEQYYKNSPEAYTNRLLKKLNSKGVLENKIKIKFWQRDKIKRTSLIGYTGLKDIFNDVQTKNGKYKIGYEIFEIAFKKQKKIKDRLDFCYLIINNYLNSIKDLVRLKNQKDFNKICDDVTLKDYYLFSAVFVGALIRLLRHFLSSEDKEFKILNKIKDNLFLKGKRKKDLINLNIDNRKIQKLFKKGLDEIVSKYKFTTAEFKIQENWGSNRWAKIESDLFYTVRDKFPNFGDESLIIKKYRK